MSYRISAIRRKSTASIWSRPQPDTSVAFPPSVKLEPLLKLFDRYALI